MSKTGSVDPMKPDWMAQSYWDNESLTRKRQMADAEARRLAAMVTANAPTQAVSMRRQLLNEAADLIDGGRDLEYGGPEKNFERIAGLLTAGGFGHTLDGQTYGPIDPHHVAIMMIFVKQARLIVSPRHRDSWTDTAGYAACGREVAEGE